MHPHRLEQRAAGVLGCVRSRAEHRIAEADARRRLRILDRRSGVRPLFGALADSLRSARGRPVLIGKGYAGMWQTTSTLLPSGSRRKAPRAGGGADIHVRHRCHGSPPSVGPDGATREPRLGGVRGGAAPPSQPVEPPQ
jgi:hypothetical protein